MWRLIKTPIKNLKIQTGFTLIELLVVLVLLGVILGAGYAALNGSFVAWAHNEAINPYIASTNVTLTQLSRDIRSSESPDSTTPAVKINANGDQMTVYKPKADSSWDIVYYRYLGTDLQRTVNNKENGTDFEGLAFPGEESDWQILLPCVASASQANSFAVQDNKIHIALEVSDVKHPEKKRFASYNVSSTYFPRNSALDSLFNQESEEEEEIIIPPAPIWNLELDDHDATITAGQVREVFITFKPINTKTEDKQVRFELSMTWPHTAEDYVSVVQDSNNPALIKISGKKRTPTILGIPYKVTIEVISTNNSSANDEIKIRVKD